MPRNRRKMDPKNKVINYPDKRAPRRNPTDTINLIYQKLWHLGEPATRKQIAEMINRDGKYPCMIQLLDQMVARGWLKQSKAKCKLNGRMMWVYEAIKYDEKGERVS